MLRNPIHKRLDRLAQDRWTRRAIRILLRSAWVGLSLLVIGLGLRMLTDWQIGLMNLIAVAMLCIAGGAVLLLRRPLSPEAAARRLDRRFGLDNQLTTALEVSARSDTHPPEGVAAYLLEHANQTTVQVQRYVRAKQRLPWMEVLTLVAVLLLALGMVVVSDIGSTANLPNPEGLPDLAAAPNTPPPDAPQQAADNSMLAGDAGAGNATGPLSAAQQQQAQAIADALRDQSATRPAAEQLDQGDTAGAAQSLRELADQANQLGDETRTDLSNQLREAADQLAPADSELAEQVRQSADALQQGADTAADGLEQLADAVEQLGDQGNSQSTANNPPPDQADPNAGPQGGGTAAGNNPVEQREREQSHERLNVDGVPLELESSGTGSAAEGDPDQIAGGVGNFSRSTAGGNADSSVVQIGDDPLYIPPELRDVVQKYFAPGQ
ncbi:MAG: hypothetical protein HC911_01855 [Chloroflexaceae bacterium]|nr:hypothetical protein [Chloroflexaceae bacterium]